MKRKLNRLNRKIIMIFMLLFRGGHKRANFLKKTKIFGSFGNNNYYFPRKLPAEPGNIYFGNNVNIATDVYFCDHDVIHHMLNNTDYVKKMENKKLFNYKTSRIIIKDNVFIGAKSIIMGDITIGNNVIIAAGSVVTKDVQDNSIYGGNPAKYICSIDEYIEKRIQSENKNIEKNNVEE